LGAARLWVVRSRGEGQRRVHRPHGAWRPEGREEVELGWGLARTHWGKGYALEAARAAGDWMFDALSLPRIASFIHIDNAPSQNLARRLGMGRGPETLHAGMPHAIWRVDRAAWTR
jgi:RimJ/RimL family protein N-acetyltransferase